MCSACDGYIKVKGKVYAQTNSNGPSQAFVDERANAAQRLVPVKNANVTVYYDADYSSEKPVDKSTLWQRSEQTGDAGDFELGGTTSPWPFHALLVVEKDGFKPVSKIFLHDKLDPHQAIIVLVPEESRTQDKPKH